MQAPPFSQRKTPPIETAKSQVEEEKRNKLRELRAEMQDLEDVFAKVRTGDTTVKLNAEYINKTRKDAANLVSQIEEGGDTVRHLLNVYEQMLQNPLYANPETEIDAQEQMHALNLLEEQVRKIEFYVGVLTIPARVNDWLHEARPGYYIPFHAVFEDEVPEAEDRARILSYLIWSPKPIKGGIVDAANGLIYRYNEDPKRRLLNILLMLGTLIAATAAVIGACYLRISGWPFQSENLSTFTAGWIAILVGVIVHVAVGSVKRTQSQGQLPSIASLGDLPLILDARSGQIMLKILLALIGLFGLAFASGVENVTPLNAFLIGYSLDSVVEIFSSGIEQRATVQASALKKQLGVTTRIAKNHKGISMDEPITSPLPPLKNEPTSEQAKPPSSQFESGFALSVETQENLSMSKAGAFLVRAEKDLELTNGGAGAIVAGKDLKVRNGGAFTIVSGGNFELENGGAQIMVIGGNMDITTGGTTIAIPGGNLTVNKGFVGVVLAKEAHLNEGSQLLLDTPRALVFGAAFGAVFALVRWLLKR